MRKRLLLRTGGGWRWLVVVGLPAWLLLFLAGPVGFAQATGMATGVAGADGVCRGCHAAIYDRYLKTPMANASGLALEKLYPGKLRHARSGVEYAVGTDAGGAWLRYAMERPGSGDVSGTERLTYFLGSGHLGTTYLYAKNGYLFESPVAYYARLKGYAMKPGLEASARMPGGLALNDACLRCHMSGVVRPDAGTDNHYSGLAFLHTGIPCEACHGETARHVESGGKVKVAELMGLPAMRRDSVCVVCHLEGDTSVERRGKRVVDFRPGEDIREYLRYFAYRGEANTRRAVSEVEQFAASRCKAGSGEGMSCMSCHDAHGSPTEAERVGFYRGKCLSCHAASEAGSRFVAGHHAEVADCTSCHMPKTSSENIAHVAWTDHRILRVPGAAAAGPAGGELVPVLAGVAGDPDLDRDLGLAYYNLVIRGDGSRRAEAERLLGGVSDADVAVLRARGVLAEMAGRDAEAERLYREILRLDPGNLTATTNLGTLLARHGQVAEAEQLWSGAFARNADLAPLGRNLAMAQCRLGDRAKAERTLRMALEYGPDVGELVGLLGEIESGTRLCVR